MPVVCGEFITEPLGNGFTPLGGLVGVPVMVTTFLYSLQV